MTERLPHSFLKEQYNKHNRMMEIKETFLPDRRAPLITSKFYSRYDKSQEAKYDPGKRKSIKLIEESRRKIPEEKYENPVTENHRYGWNLPQIQQMDKIDGKIFFRPRTSCQLTKHGAQLAKEKFIYRSGPFVKSIN